MALTSLVHNTLSNTVTCSNRGGHPEMMQLKEERLKGHYSDQCEPSLCHVIGGNKGYT